MNNVHIYLLAGVATSRGFFYQCTAKMEQLCEHYGWNPQVHVLFPYGDNSRSLLAQVRDVAGDLTKWIGAVRTGGRYVADQLRENLANEPIILIGHSGGGAAAYQAVRILRQEQARIPDVRIIQIGSPKVPIHPELREQVCYVQAIDDAGKSKDPITRIGSWGGWSLDRLQRLPGWNVAKYAPGHIELVRLIGGHADYLRHEPPFVDEDQVSNLEKTLNLVWSWLSRSLT